MVERRTVLKGLAGLPLSAILSNPELARAAASATSLVTVSTKSGREVTGALALPAQTPAPVVLLVHEWWGLNDQIRAVAAELADLGYVALAVDLFDGHVATTPEDAKAQTQAVDPKVASEIMAAWVEWAGRDSHGNGRVALMGWCFGGGWSLNGSVIAPVDATIVYYGKCDLPAEQLAHLKGPVLGHFATRDKYIDKPMVARFEAAMHQADKPYQIFWYEADHAFANPTGQNYEKPESQLAWDRTTAFLAAKLR